jgi:hypothetical protein
MSIALFPSPWAAESSSNRTLTRAEQTVPGTLRASRTTSGPVRATISALSRSGSRLLRLSALAWLLAAGGAVGASAEIVAPGVPDGLLAASLKGTPLVAFVRGGDLMISTRTAGGKWRAVKAAAVPARSGVMAFRVGAKGPVALVQTADNRTLLLVRRTPRGWQTKTIASRLARHVSLGWPGLALDRAGLPAIAYTRWNYTTYNSRLLLVRFNASGRTRSQQITAEGFPQSYVAPPAAPVFVGSRVHVVESYGYGTVVGGFEWYPDRHTWTGLGIDVGRGEMPVGPVLAQIARRTLYATWTQTLVAFAAFPVTLAVRHHDASSAFILDRALTTALAVPASGPEVAANEWVGSEDVGLAGDSVLWAGSVVSGSSKVELDGWVAGLTAPSSGGRDLLLARAAGLEWFHSRSKLATRVTVRAAPTDSGFVISGRVEGVRSGSVGVYRERLGSSRQKIGEAAIVDGSFSIADHSPSAPFLYRAVYIDPSTHIPYAALLHPARSSGGDPGSDGSEAATITNARSR